MLEGRGLPPRVSFHHQDGFFETFRVTAPAFSTHVISAPDVPWSGFSLKAVSGAHFEGIRRIFCTCPVMMNDSIEVTPELVRLAREHKSSLQRLSQLVAGFEASARAEDERYVLRTSPHRWEKNHGVKAQARCF